MKFVKQSIAILILISILVLSSCEYLPFLSDNEQSDVQSNPQGDEFVDGNHPYHYLFPEGYTGGFNHQPGANIEYWWVETYEECLAAIELLKSHDSTFDESVIFTYEGDLFDTKYCFKITTNNRHTEKIKFGDNPFDRRALNVKVKSYAFFEDVTIDEINHSYVNDYKVSSMLMENSEKLKATDFCIENAYYKWNNEKNYYEIFDSETEEVILITGRFEHESDPLYADKCAEAVVDSLMFIGFDD